MKLPNLIKQSLFFWSLFMVFVYFSACQREELTLTPFYEEESRSITDFIVEKEDSFSNFQEVMKTGKLFRTLQAYNPDGNDYTLFLPTDEAFDRFIGNSDTYGSFQEFLNDSGYVRNLSRYHVVNLGMDRNEFPFGALPEETLSGDLLTVGTSGGLDSTVLKINKYASIIRANVKMSNGYIHVIDEVLVPITYNSYEWLNRHPEYSIFAQALEATGLNNISKNNTLLVESNEVLSNVGVTSFEELVNRYSPNNSDYTNYDNDLYQFVAYHILRGKYLLSNYEGVNDNYNTYGSSPVSINGRGLDIRINQGTEVFDTLIDGNDTTIVDYIGVDYDRSNEITTNGVVHFIDNNLQIFKPRARTRTFQFYEDPMIDSVSQQAQTILFEDTTGFELIKWQGISQIMYRIGSVDNTEDVYNNYLYIMNDEFTITYDIPKVLPSKYVFQLIANGSAVIQVYLDGEKMGESFDLADKRNEINLGEVKFDNYANHQIKIEAKVSGSFRWYGVRFIPEIENQNN